MYQQVGILRSSGSPHPPRPGCFCPGFRLVCVPPSSERNVLPCMAGCQIAWPSNRSGSTTRRNWNESTRTCGSHRRCRPDQLLPHLPHRQRQHAGPGPAGHPAAARDPAGHGRPPGRADGAQRLRLPAGCRRHRHRRPERGLQGCGLRPAGRFPAARSGHGALRPARRQRRHLHRPGQGHRRERQGRRQGPGRRQPVQHQRLHRPRRGDQGRPHQPEQLPRHAAPRPQPRPDPTGPEGRSPGLIAEATGRLGQPLAVDVR